MKSHGFLIHVSTLTGVTSRTACRERVRFYTFRKRARSGIWFVSDTTTEDRWPRRVLVRSSVAQARRKNSHPDPFSGVYHHTHAASPCAFVPRLRGDSRPAELSRLQLGIVRVHQPLDSQAGRTPSSTASGVARNGGGLSRIDQPHSDVRNPTMGEERGGGARGSRARRMALASANAPWGKVEQGRSQEKILTRRR